MDAVNTFVTVNGRAFREPPFALAALLSGAVIFLSGTRFS